MNKSKLIVYNKFIIKIKNIIINKINKFKWIITRRKLSKEK